MDFLWNDQANYASRDYDVPNLHSLENVESTIKCMIDPTVCVCPPVDSVVEYTADCECDSSPVVTCALMARGGNGDEKNLLRYTTKMKSSYGSKISNNRTWLFGRNN
jgi:hypothetical protein